MHTLTPFVLSFFFPGIGQLTLKDYSKGLLIISTWLISVLLISQTDFQIYFLHIFIHFAFVIWSLFDLFDKVEKLEGRNSATRKLALGVIISLILIPTVMYFLFAGLFKSGEFIADEYLNEDRTKEEMNVISTALGNYKAHYGYFPQNFDSFISTKPIRAGWKSDSWNNNYNYELIDSLNYRLISAGKDGIKGNDDDLITKN